ncbi:bifunctional phosphopantothenoylcysteine decarboxylase/phosphopantothenate synthase [Gallibacterium salpingitidis]|uniref:Coenzyme A biosynthesis bifunctional protein CoaBC n=1 Tax=Gallibacterium salpingitidis TaxID=505341 RepID=A0AB36E3U8_9PAST|nr:bifunctional phosphopantothenoylcysteine decarboxylase/phosphopantothenate--cysteine ligase CoaBC [Gallibacterium salpingitidis]OBX11339.1 bifunctional phosphopantothenoylcysteine decarboxylase/phosphopantothenate synthase [Gallibacterium salpingitidis]WKS99224.1 bifunctional phosphopantothenoylcysteine decarboxylase/phosphopantothenate--cysteine ligase CoaBC [Gallibacterium salpingitidis]
MDNILQQKRILVGITGGIAAYKTIEFIRLLRKQNAEVRVVLTEAASHFVSPLTLQAISGNAVSQSLFDPQAELAMGHIELAKWADAIVIAPATADFLARFNLGLANDLLTTLCLATSAPIFIAPAMNQQMYAQTVVQQHLSSLRQRGITIIGPNSGEQACGDVGAGRMSEPAEIFTEVADVFCREQPLAGITVAITAGPTQEPIDPVRYISNYSSGKMGYAIAEAFAQQGATVTLISGPVNLTTPSNVKKIAVTTAQQMWQQAMAAAVTHQIFIGCAAVADYRVAEIAPQKIKKSGDELTLKLVKNPDIIADVGHLKEHRPFTVGFAAETQDVENYAKDKLVRKQLDLICANDVSIAGQGFSSDQNALQLFWHKGSITLPLTNKRQLAEQLVNHIINLYQTTKNNDEKN